MKFMLGILLIFFVICVTTAFWLDYFARQREKIMFLEKEIGRMEEQLDHRARELNRLSKERNFWIMETNRLRQKG